MSDKTVSRAVVLSGPAVVRLVHQNVTDNLRARTTPTLKFPTLLTLARDVVAQDRLIVVHETRRSNNG